MRQKVAGLIPAAGIAERISPLPCSKEIYPIGFHGSNQNKDFRVKVVSECLLESMHIAGVAEVYIILRKGKWDIPQYLGSGKWMGMNFAYLLMDLPFGVPFTLDQAYPFIKKTTVAFGFPDIIFDPADAFIQLLEKQSDSNSDIVLGLFPSKRNKKDDLIEFDKNGRIKAINIKSDSKDLLYTWIIAVWSSEFTEFLHEYVREQKKLLLRNNPPNDKDDIKELFISEVIQAGILKDLKCDHVIFKEGDYLDIGTSDDLIKASTESRV
jgi:glucose-1-phosphate thymidylyltransferase